MILSLKYLLNTYISFLNYQNSALTVANCFIWISVIDIFLYPHLKKKKKAPQKHVFQPV